MLDRPAVADALRLPLWTGECVAIVAAGASANAKDLAILRDRIHVIAINKSYELVPWADMLYACDVNFWHLERGVPSFTGIKVTQDVIAKSSYPGLIRIEVTANSDELMLTRYGHVGAGGNSGFQALNLAIQMGATGIALFGIDCIGEHWHGRHLPPCTNPSESNFIRWRKSFDGIVPTLKQMGIDVVNCSPISTIRAYPKMTAQQALERWRL